MTTTQPLRIRRFQGQVLSAKTPKTLVVEVARSVEHPKYHKIYTTHRRFHVHDPLGKFRAGDTVEFVACRPISRTKRWLVVYPKS
ncbi:MAG: small subunit ribosomal protein S17 [Parcubacteria group bacterium Gr01-1014_31]|nr:MAG: small subunit ribosomal protein S17 [Parcubacteria group bacterium Gr01-1014_31]